MNIKKLIGGLLTKAEKTSTGYLVALEEKQQLLVQIQLQLVSEQEKLKDYHKLSLMKQVSESTYEEQKNVVAKMNESIDSIHLEMKQITLYRTEDVENVLSEIQKNKPEFNKHQQAEIQKIKNEIASARQEYLERIASLGKQYDSATKEESMIQQFLVDFGKQPNMYLPYKYEIIGNGAVVSSEVVDQIL